MADLTPFLEILDTLKITLSHGAVGGDAAKAGLAIIEQVEGVIDQNKQWKKLKLLSLPGKINGILDKFKVNTREDFQCVLLIKEFLDNVFFLLSDKVKPRAKSHFEGFTNKLTAKTDAYKKQTAQQVAVEIKSSSSAVSFREQVKQLEAVFANNKKEFTDLKRRCSALIKNPIDDASLEKLEEASHTLKAKLQSENEQHKLLTEKLTAYQLELKPQLAKNKAIKAELLEIQELQKNIDFTNVHAKQLKHEFSVIVKFENLQRVYQNLLKGLNQYLQEKDNLVARFKSIFCRTQAEQRQIDFVKGFVAELENIRPKDLKNKKKNAILSGDLLVRVLKAKTVLRKMEQKYSGQKGDATLSEFLDSIEKTLGPQSPKNFASPKLIK